ncbi:MAG: cyclic nucleotide-binding domain-containing protein, partial [Myxococcales bacterium]|nr:cyclic nucleotide-binding domain-containing protein [Myxococcales bacterium]
GDSRAYLLRGDGVLRLTRDHNYEQVLLERGLDPDRAAEHPAASKLTQALGFGPVVPDVARVDVAPGDRLLLCSDGLYDMVDVGSLAAAVHERALGTAVELLIGEANRAGGLDNITVALLECAGQPDLSQILAHLRSQTLFERLDESELRSLATVLERRPFRAGEELMGEGKVGTDCLLLVRGKAHASRAGVHLTTIREGGHAGELALIRPWRRTATVTATTDGMAFVLTRHAFESLCALRPTLGLRLHRTLALRVADRLADLTTRIEKVQRAVDGL